MHLEHPFLTYCTLRVYLKQCSSLKYYPSNVAISPKGHHMIHILCSNQLFFSESRPRQSMLQFVGKAAESIDTAQDDSLILLFYGQALLECLLFILILIPSSQTSNPPARVGWSQLGQTGYLTYRLSRKRSHQRNLRVCWAVLNRALGHEGFGLVALLLTERLSDPFLFHGRRTRACVRW